MTAGVFRLHQPARQETPVIFASPHSGAAYHPDFLAQSVLDARQIRSSEDAFVDRLLADAPSHGAALLVAEVPRAYLDLNRAPDELDPAVIEGISRAPHNPRVSSGLGVIPRVVSGGRSIYRGKLSRAEAETRITGFWHPYHRALRDLVEATHSRFGQAILIDCHSMPHEALEHHSRPGVDLPDVVLGDRFGAASAPWVMTAVEAAFQAEGFRVSRNTPFAGAFIAQSYGRPSAGRHVVQVEIDRSLYMDEDAIAPLPQFDAFSARMGQVVRRLSGIGRQDIPLAAE
ncbi:N-formylglutamate amidohydrolase [Tabrizicola oligotrophica]|uniref:N-formylglutamate amidohydrolase n=1 Tax=Tabrizicola oligotrophica TaxID=2710650 RepID=A0A6M0QRV6_9RHOB|nr:N-formylglutamate amidohydrolase [Tabrizicola oligotrophica]NEY90215.1 N-formylglutamate amidohydrolase [Tabrizicola oligotrophica]